MLVSTLLITPLFLRFVKCERNERSKAGLIDGKLRPVIRYIFVVGSCDVMDVKNRWMKGFFLSFFDKKLFKQEEFVIEGRMV